jgi:hypothetical protein
MAQQEAQVFESVTGQWQGRMHKEKAGCMCVQKEMWSVQLVAGCSGGCNLPWVRTPVVSRTPTPTAAPEGATADVHVSWSRQRK